MAAATATAVNPLDHLDASLEDFEPSIGSRSPEPHQQRQTFGYPSTHSGFRSNSSEEGPDDMLSDLGEVNEGSDSDSGGGYSPPAWRRLDSGDRSSGFWREGPDLPGQGFSAGLGLDDPSLFSSRESSPECFTDAEDEEDEILERAARTRLPSGSLSPEKEDSPKLEEEYRFPAFPAVPQHRIEDDTPHIKFKAEETDDEDDDEVVQQVLDDYEASMRNSPREPPDNYIRFAVRAEVQQRTEPIDAAVNFLRNTRLGIVTRSWTSFLLSSVAVFVSYAMLRSLFSPPAPNMLRPVPDLVKVAGVARSFEPLIYISENGIHQVGELQATGVAVWDLGESVRSSNISLAPVIVKELDDLSDNLNTLAIELTRFFANVDGDIDSILIVMDWCRRELAQLQSSPTRTTSIAYDNIHNLLYSAGVLETLTGEPTRFGSVLTSIFGQSTPQRTVHTLQRTFNELLAVLEEAIANELSTSVNLFALFESIDRQFSNLARTVVKESATQDEQQDQLLSSLWTRILGPRASDVAKYERNRVLLLNLRERTVSYKGALIEHNHKLLALKASLENLRRKLVSPLVRSQNSSTLTVEEQIKGLEDVGVYLEGVRTRQKSKLLELMFGSGRQREPARLVIDYEAVGGR